MRRLNLTVPSLFALTVLAGCASGPPVAARQPYMGEEIDRPDRIIVHDFAATSTDVPPESDLAGRIAGYLVPQTAGQIETGRTLGAQVALNLVAEIQNMGLPAVWAGSQLAPQAGDLVIRGYFVSVVQDSAGERMLVGFSSETADLRTIVEGYLGADQWQRRLETGLTGTGSEKVPYSLADFTTLAATGSPLDLVTGGTSNLKRERKDPPTIKDAAQATASEIADQLRMKFREQGWI
ncbi:DUF4410 domain-containing protein [Methylobacter marinus]|uniref:DUF4410 domain-containing protein n=1 Tax=Methylobacter marinus TaxID=34058 RepID=UPI00058D4055|nr:DUF4410 domain-containing protein [Methylobacter marinus]